MELLDLEVQNKIVSAIKRVMKQRGWAMYDEDNFTYDYNPLYMWDGNIIGHDLNIHHRNYHPKYGFIIYRGHFYSPDAVNTNKNRKNIIDKETLEDNWNEDEYCRIQYDNYLLEILAKPLLSIKKRYNLKELKISISNEHFKVIKDTSILTYNI